MNKLSANKGLLAIIAVLLITNLILLFFCFRMNRTEKQHKGPGFTERLRKDVGFTAEQMSLYEPKKKIFWENMRARFEKIKTTKKDFYYFMYDSSVPDSVMEAKADTIGTQQKELDMFVIKHFKEVRRMCTPEQLPKFDSLLPPIIERMTARPQRK